jgi:hypothetical protein
MPQRGEGCRVVAPLGEDGLTQPHSLPRIFAGLKNRRMG